jgi:arrestin-related trafficking adapter 4/5/7
VDKIEYSVSTASKAVIFGTQIPVEMKLIPLLKGLKIGKITCRLAETQEYTIQLAAYPVTHTTRRDIVTDESFVPDTVEQINEEGQEGFMIHRKIQLPKSLTQCVQDVNCKNIRVRHKLHFSVQLHNPDGHISEVKGNVPVFIFISPNLPLDEDNNIVDLHPADALGIDALSQHAPPLYGEHGFDQLWSDVDPSGYMTPAPMSGMSTPFAAESRSGSAENLASMTGLIHSGAAGGPRPGELQSRLRNLPDFSNGSRQNSRRNLHDYMSGTSGQASGEASPGTDDGNQRSPPNGHGDYFNRSIATSPPSTAPITRRTSEEEEDIANSLSQVPSYSTAVRTPGLRSSYLEDLPTYDTAISQPPSPPTPSIQEEDEGSVLEMTRQVSGLTIRGVHRSSSNHIDQEALLRIRRARA